jgi:hypothetical protein
LAAMSRRAIERAQEQQRRSHGEVTDQRSTTTIAAPNASMMGGMQNRVTIGFQCWQEEQGMETWSSTAGGGTPTGCQVGL